MLFPAHAAESHQFILEILCCSPLCCRPFLFIVPLSEENSLKASLSFCREELAFAHKRAKWQSCGARRELELHGFFSFSSFLLSSCTHTRHSGCMRGDVRVTDSDVCVLLLWLFTSSFACSPSHPSSRIPLFFWVVVFFGFSRLAEADAGCSVVTVGDGSTRAEMSLNGVCVCVCVEDYSSLLAENWDHPSLLPPRDGLSHGMYQYSSEQGGLQSWKRGVQDKARIKKRETGGEGGGSQSAAKGNRKRWGQRQRKKIQNRLSSVMLWSWEWLVTVRIWPFL